MHQASFVLMNLRLPLPCVISLVPMHVDPAYLHTTWTLLSSMIIGSSRGGGGPAQGLGPLHGPTVQFGLGLHATVWRKWADD